MERKTVARKRKRNEDKKKVVAEELHGGKREMKTKLKY